MIGDAMFARYRFTPFAPLAWVLVMAASSGSSSAGTPSTSARTLGQERRLKLARQNAGASHGSWNTPTYQDLVPW